MAITIASNIASLDAQRNLAANSSALQQSLQRLSSGYRINRSADDAAGLQISESLKSQINGSNQALQNAQDGISVLNIADGAQGVIQDNLQRVRELTVQAANDTLATNQRNAITTEITQRLSDITRIANSTQFNGVSLLASAGSPSSYYIELGANSDQTNDRINVASALGDTTSSGGLSVSFSAGNIANNSAAQSFLSTIDTALTTLNTKRATLGALTNRLESAISNLSVSVENLSSANSRIRDVDVASESAKLTQNQILQQAATSILSQANQSPQLALTLIGH